MRQEGKRQVKRQLKHYNLDAIISVGYRVNSGQVTRFRQGLPTYCRTIRFFYVGGIVTLKQAAKTFHLDGHKVTLGQYE